MDLVSAGGGPQYEAGAAAAAGVGGDVSRQSGDRQDIPRPDPVPQVKQGDHQAQARAA